MMKYPVWLDCDVGVDDAVAILAAHGHPQIDLLAISTVAGNVELKHTFRNAHSMNLLMGTNYPIYKGADRPLMRELHVATAFHGENGLGDVELPFPDDAVMQEKPAWDAMYEAACKYPGELRLIAVGPLTNVAIALAKYPDFASKLHTILIMGGSASVGNVTPAAEFNIYDDPEAAEKVFKCGVPLVMCGLDVTLKATLRPEDMDELAATGKVGTFVRDCLQHAWKTLKSVGFEGVAMHDSCAVLYLVHPELFTAQKAGVHVETRGTVGLGRTVTDLHSDKKFDKRETTVVLDVNREKFIKILKDCVKNV